MALVARTREPMRLLLRSSGTAGLMGTPGTPSWSDPVPLSLRALHLLSTSSEDRDQRSGTQGHQDGLRWRGSVQQLGSLASAGLLRQPLSLDVALWQLDARRSISFQRFLSTQPRPKPSKALPDAEDCDDALEVSQELRSRLDKLQRPSTLKPWSVVLRDVALVIWGGTLTVGRFLLSMPGRIMRIMSMPREEWRRKLSGAWEVVKHEAHHYWVGTKLLGYDIKIATRLATKTARGHELSRRERKQLTRTVADIFRLVPLLIIMVVPFLEFALPVLLRIFPNMLPSTFEDKLKKEAELKRQLGLKLELARFMQDTVAEMAKDIARKKKGSREGADLLEFIKRVRAGEPVENHELIRFAQLFNDELTLDNLERVQLASLCQFVGITPFGSDSYLRNRLRVHLQQIKRDDYDIEKEGLENLTEDELRSACRARGMRAVFGEEAADFMRRQVQDWLELSLHRGLPSSLLLLSRAFTITAAVKDVAKKKDIAYDKLKETLSTIPEEVVEVVEYETGEASGVEALQKRLEILRREEELIKEELGRAEAAARAAREALAPATPAAGAAAAGAPGVEAIARAAAAATAPAAAPAVAAEAAAPAAPAPLKERLSSEEKVAVAEEAQEKRLRATIQALVDLAATSGVAKERALFMDLMTKEIEHLNESLLLGAAGQGPAQHTQGAILFSGKEPAAAAGAAGAAPGAAAAAGAGAPGAGAGAAAEAEAEAAATGAPKRLADRVSKMLASIEKDLDKAEGALGSRMQVLDKDRDGVISQEELQSALAFLKAQLTPDEFQLLLQRLTGQEGSLQDIKVDQLVSFALKKEGEGDHPGDDSQHKDGGSGGGSGSGGSAKGSSSGGSGSGSGSGGAGVRMAGGQQGGPRGGGGMVMAPGPEVVKIHLL